MAGDNAKTKTGKVPAPAAGGAAAAVLAELKSLRSEVEEMRKPKTKATGKPSEVFGVPNAIVGERGERPYSILKAAAFARGLISAEDAKEEVQIGMKLKAVYNRFGFTSQANGPAFMVPFASEHIPQLDQESEGLVAEVRAKMCGGWKQKTDPEEMAAINKKVGGAYTKALGALADTAGGVLVGFPTLGELIDLQRNLEVMPNAGATETTLPPNGRIQYPKLSGGATAYWVGEGTTITSSQQTTGYLDLIAKKLGVVVYINNELLKWNTISAEAMVRLDMARVGALLADLAMLQGTGGTQVLGIIQYPTQSSWTSGTDKLLSYSVTGASTSFAPADAANMVELLPDVVQEPTAWIMRKDEWSKIINRRADSVTTGDGAGPFVFGVMQRTAAEKPVYELYGTKVIRSSQVSNTRSSTKTYILVGYWPDFIIARSGVMEFLASNVSDVALLQDQTILRGLQYLDAGFRHPASAVFADAVTIA